MVFGSLLGLCFVFLYFLFSALEQKGEQGWGTGLGPHIGVVELTGPSGSPFTILRNEGASCEIGFEPTTSGPQSAVFTFGVVRALTPICGAQNLVFTATGRGTP